MKLICSIATSILLSKGNASPLSWGVYTKQNNEVDNYESELPGLRNGDYVDDYDTYLNEENYEEFQGLDYSSLHGNADLIDAGSEVFGMCPVDNKCQQGCVPLNNAQISEESYNCTCWKGYELLCNGYTCGESYDEAKPEFVNDGSCPEGFIPLGGVSVQGSSKLCFFLGDTKGTRAKAQKYCEEMGAQLAKIENKEQNFHLGQLMTDEKIFWTGGKFVDFDFIWEDSSEMKFKKWAKNEPTMNLETKTNSDDFEPENCVVSNWGYLSEWNDLHCEHDDMYFVCSTEPHW